MEETMTDFMEEVMTEDRHLWRLRLNRWILAQYMIIIGYVCEINEIYLILLGVCEGGERIMCNPHLFRNLI